MHREYLSSGGCWWNRRSKILAVSTMGRGIPLLCVQVPFLNGWTSLWWCVTQLMLCRSRAGGLIYSGRELISQLFYSWSSCNCAAARYWLVGTAGTTFWSLLPFHCQDLLTYFAWLLDTSSVFSLIHCFGFKVCSALLSFANPKTDTCHQLQPM